LLPSGPGGVHRELAVSPYCKDTTILLSFKIISTLYENKPFY